MLETFFTWYTWCFPYVSQHLVTKHSCRTSRNNTQMPLVFSSIAAAVEVGMLLLLLLLRRSVHGCF